MTNTEALALIDPTTGLAPNEVVCIVCRLAYHIPLGACPECQDAHL